MGAQAWHALTGYVIFRVATEALGDAGYGAFTSVLWTMTTLEVLVTEGAPRAMGLRIARSPAGTAALLRRTLFATHGVALLLCAALFVVAPFIAAAWQADHLADAVRISGLDFLTFAGFAVFAALANGLHSFAAQARVQFVYSTIKVVVVSVMVWQTRSVAGVMLGYVLASLGGSVAAWLLTRSLPRAPEPECAAEQHAPAWPFALQSVLLLLLLNVDLWISAALVGADSARLGIYGMAATLCRSVFFVLRAVGEALLPSVASAHAAAAHSEVRVLVRRGMSLLFVLLLPITAVGMACGGSVLALLFGEQRHAEGEVFLRFLLPAAAAFTLLAVQVALLNAARGALRAVLLLSGALVAATVACQIAAHVAGIEGVALAACASSVAAMLVGMLLLRRVFGAVVPWGALGYSAVAAGGVYAAASAWQPAGWWVFVWGALLCGLCVAGALACGVLARQRSAHATPPQE